MARVGWLVCFTLLGLVEPKALYSSHFDLQIQSNYLEDLHEHGLLEDASLKVVSSVEKSIVP